MLREKHEYYMIPPTQKEWGTKLWNKCHFVGIKTGIVQHVIKVFYMSLLLKHAKLISWDVSYMWDWLLLWIKDGWSLDYELNLEHPRMNQDCSLPSRVVKTPALYGIYYCMREVPSWETDSSSSQSRTFLHFTDIKEYALSLPVPITVLNPKPDAANTYLLIISLWNKF